MVLAVIRLFASSLVSGDSSCIDERVLLLSRSIARSTRVVDRDDMDGDATLLASTGMSVGGTHDAEDSKRCESASVVCALFNSRAKDSFSLIAQTNFVTTCFTNFANDSARREARSSLKQCVQRSLHVKYGQARDCPAGTTVVHVGGRRPQGRHDLRVRRVRSGLTKQCHRAGHVRASH